MRYLSVCSGIEAASVAWKDFSWDCVGLSEISAFQNRVLEKHYPNVINYGDMNEYDKWCIDGFDLLVGGTPCQSFSLAGKRGGLDDERGNLSLIYCRILERYKPKWFIWENVSGVLSSNGGRDFGMFLNQVAKCGYGFSYRVLDSQYFGSPQQRRRVFVVGYYGDWRPSAKILFDENCSERGVEQSKKKKHEITRAFSESFDNKEPIGFMWQNSFSLGMKINLSPTVIVAQTVSVCYDDVIRKLSPIEVERLQGFPDDYTKIEGCSDYDRYKVLGNSMNVNVMRWLGKQINEIIL